MRLFYSAKAVVRKRNKPSFEGEPLQTIAVVLCKVQDGRAWGICGIEITAERSLKISHVFGETSEIISFLSDLFSNLLSKSSRGKKWQMEDEMFSFVKNERWGASLSRAHAHYRSFALFAFTTFTEISVIN